MSKNNNYNLLDGLFPQNKPSEGGTNTVIPKNNRQKKTFKIEMAFWGDFLDLVAAKNVTQEDLINELIKDEINANKELIERYRAFRSESFGAHKK